MKFNLAGYQERIINIDAKLNGWYVGNILIGGLIGMLIIDPASGAMYKIDRLDVNERLDASSTSGTKTNNKQLQFYSINDIPAHLKSRLVEIK